MKKTSLLLLVMTILVIISLCACKKEEIPEAATETVPAESPAFSNEELPDVIGFSFKHVGIPMEDNYTYSAVLDKDKSIVTVEIEGIDTSLNEEDPALFDRIVKLINDHELTKWNGFHKVDSTVNTIDEFSLQIEYSDQSVLSASGSCAYPDNYEDVLSQIKSIFKPYREKLLRDIAKEANADNPEISIGRSYDAYYSDKKERVIANLTYPQISMSETSAAKYPELKKALESLNSDNEARLSDSYDIAKEAAIDEIENGDMDGYLYTVEEDLHVHRCDPNVVSLLCDGYSFAGGAHGIYYVSGYNFDTKTGKLLSLSDISDDPDKLIRMIPSELKAKYPPDTFYVDLDEYISDVLLDTSLLTWSLNHDSITFYFNVYEVAPYAAGLLTASIPFEGNSELFRPEVSANSSMYISELSDNAALETDMDGDGHADTLEIFYDSEYDENNSFMNYSGVHLILNGNDTAYDYYGFSHNAYYIRKDDGNAYIYIVAQVENDYTIWYEYRISSEGTSFLGQTFGSIPYFTNPESFDIYEPTSLLGTLFGSKNYYIGDFGIPQTDDYAYIIDTQKKFDVMLPFEGEEIDAQGDPTGNKIKVEAGDTALPVRTDNFKYVDLKTDSTYVRVNVESSDWPHTIDGVDIEDIFKGIVFAG